MRDWCRNGVEQSHDWQDEKRSLQRDLMIFQLLIIIQIQFSSQFFLRQHIVHVFHRVDLAVVLRQHHTHQRVALCRAQQQADGWVAPRRHLCPHVVVHIHLNLPDVLMGQVAGFQIDQHKAFQDKDVEEEINIKVPAVDVEVFLSRHEGKAASLLQGNLLQMIDERLFQLRFVVMLVRRQVQKLQHVRIADDLFILRLGFGFLYLFADTLLVAAGQQALMELSIDLPFQLTNASPGPTQLHPYRTRVPNRFPLASVNDNANSSIRYTVWSELETHDETGAYFAGSVC